MKAATMTENIMYAGGNMKRVMQTMSAHVAEKTIYRQAIRHGAAVVT